jgi:ABC-2 type transport system permease protein
VGILISLEYRFSFFIELLNSFFPIIVQFFVWSAVYGSSKASVINGLTFEELIMYIAIASLMSKILTPGIEDEISNDIRNGGLNIHLVRPISYFKSKIFTSVGRNGIHMLISLPIILVIYVMLAVYWQMPSSLFNIVLFLVSIIFSFLLDFCLFYCLSLIAFWTTQTWGIMIAFRIIINILSGGVLPLRVLGNLIDSISIYLPFRYIIEFPICILQGNYSVNEVIFGITIQIVSIIMIALISNEIWRRGQKQYMAVGG